MMGILTLRFIWRLFRIRLRPKPSPAVRPRSAPTPFVLGCEPKGACLREGPSEGHIVVSLCSELLLGFKLVRVASGIEDGVALQAISRGLVDSALGEDSPPTNSFSASPPMAAKAQCEPRARQEPRCSYVRRELPMYKDLLNATADVIIFVTCNS